MVKDDTTIFSTSWKLPQPGNNSPTTSVDDSPPVLQIPKNVFQVLGLLGDFLVLHSHGLGRRFFLRFGVSWIGLLVGERCCHGLGGDTAVEVSTLENVFFVITIVDNSTIL